MGNLRNRSSFWMQVTVSFNETTDEGLTKEKKEQYVVEAASFIDAETNIRREMDYNNRPVKVLAIVKPKFGAVCFSDDATAENWYKVKVVITEEEEVRTRKGGTRTKSKIVPHFHLVQASGVDSARQAIKEVVYKDSQEDYEIADIVKTRILDVLENEKHLQTLSLGE